MASYPLVIRNRVPLFYRAFMIVWLAGVALITWVALRDGMPEPERWWPWFMAVFWIVGLSALVWSLNQELSEIRIPGPRSIHVRRGKAFRRVEHWTDHGQFWIKDDQNSDGGPYFQLMMDAPGGKMVVKEGHSRPAIEKLLAEIEEAVKGRA